MSDKTTATLPTGAADRKNIPIVRGLLDYFPAALAAVAELSRIGNEQHNPGEEMHWARGKSGDHADCIVRHAMDRGTIDTDNVRHSTKTAWRALALLQEELEAAGAPLARGARLPAGPIVIDVRPVRAETDDQREARRTKNARARGYNGSICGGISCCTEFDQ
jgi:hypothetical protein